MKVSGGVKDRELCLLTLCPDGWISLVERTVCQIAMVRIHNSDSDCSFTETFLLRR